MVVVKRRLQLDGLELVQEQLIESDCGVSEMWLVHGDGFGSCTVISLHNAAHLSAGETVAHLQLYEFLRGT